jgi:hypothetical protein
MAIDERDTGGKPVNSLARLEFDATMGAHLRSDERGGFRVESRQTRSRPTRNACGGAMRLPHTIMLAI